jgi:L,D-peptidoglycan transpeptidase YkuD (ErfK/YbiS/YcfS/YnhG family)
MTRALVLVLVIAACHRDKPAPPPPEPVHAPVAPQVPPTPIRAETTQLVTAVPADWSATTATLRLWQRQPGRPWQAMGEPWTAVIGATGSAWGIGLHGDAAPFGHTGPKKQEGDQKSPAGSFGLRAAYGYAAAPPAGTRLPYTPSDDTTKCVDDPASLHYATIVNQASVQVDWHSAEDMHRKDALYTWVIDVAHNPSRVPGEGSCIFLHVWKDPDSATVGCTAMPAATLEHLLAQLDPAAHPTYVLLPRAEYTSLAAAWGLPPL